MISAATAVVHLCSDVRSCHETHGLIDWKTRKLVLVRTGVWVESVELPTGPWASGSFQVATVAAGRCRGGVKDTLSTGVGWYRCTGTAGLGNSAFAP